MFGFLDMERETLPSWCEWAAENWRGQLGWLSSYGGIISNLMTRCLSIPMVCCPLNCRCVSNIDRIPSVGNIRLCGPPCPSKSVLSCSWSELQGSPTPSLAGAFVEHWTGLCAGGWACALQSDFFCREGHYASLIWWVCSRLLVLPLVSCMRPRMQSLHYSLLLCMELCWTLFLEGAGWTWQGHFLPGFCCCVFDGERFCCEDWHLDLCLFQGHPSRVLPSSPQHSSELLWKISYYGSITVHGKDPMGLRHVSIVLLETKILKNCVFMVRNMNTIDSTNEQVSYN